jgi:hypothetical protein
MNTYKNYYSLIYFSYKKTKKIIFFRMFFVFIFFLFYLQFMNVPFTKGQPVKIQGSQTNLHLKQLKECS